MKKENPPVGVSGRLWKSFASMKLTVTVLLTLAITSIIGTVIPQNEASAAYVHEYGENLYRVLDTLNIFDMYHSWWYLTILLTLCANIVVCSIDRFSATWKIIFVKVPKFKISRFQTLPGKQELSADLPPEQLKEMYKPLVAKRFGYTTIEAIDKGFCIFAEKGRWTRMGAYVVHISIILLILGAIIGAIFGFDGYVNIPEGEGIKHIILRSSGKAHHLPFEIRCNDFNLSFYDTGAPKEYRSALSIMEDGKSSANKNIIVNDPLRYKGINIFQSSYGVLPPKEITLNFASTKTGEIYTKKMTIGESIDLPEGLGSFAFKKILNSYKFHDHNMGECIVGTLVSSKGKTKDIIVPFRFAEFDRMRKGNVSVSIKDFTRIYYTGLQVSGDPGVPVVYAAFIVMILGIYISFFMSHQRLCIEVEKKGVGSKITVSGISNKDSIGMERKVNRISKVLAKLTQGKQEAEPELLNAGSIFN